MFCACATNCQLTVEAAHDGGYRVTAATSDRHAARLVFHRVSKPSADYEREAYQTRALLEVRILAHSVGAPIALSAVPASSRTD